jgi:hypothetical protein
MASLQDLIREWDELKEKATEAVEAFILTRGDDTLKAAATSSVEELENKQPH